ncbi:HelD family protein [Kineococcus sp. SYSU DK003]|uniref:HelD family protein n=1 Tax=Kineococcus sp. SYSU DK003 TaxID=3383124 RepID=UPI003D7E55CD
MNPLDEEQEFLTTFHAVRRETLSALGQRLRHLLQHSAQSGQALLEREARVRQVRRRTAALEAAGDGLCFGRLDLEDGAVLHVGRVALSDDAHAPLLLDWRAPAARPFYTATARFSEGVRRRRHIATRAERVVAVDDEHLTAPEDVGSGSPQLAPGGPSSSALLSALELPRTGVMRDIVTTIQAEQDEIVRAPLPGVLAVQGGPGTGKTAVALHRTAYLLYTHRELLEARGVLIVGPSRTFLDYVGQVLPALGETAVVMVTAGQLLPGVDTEHEDPPETAQLKGSPVMLDVLAAAVADRQAVPAAPVELDLSGFTLAVPPRLVAACRERARASGLRHNRARALFAARLFEAVTAEYVAQLGADPFGGPNLLAGTDVTDLHTEVRESPDVHALLEQCWPVLDPQRLLQELFTCPQRLRRAAADLAEDRRALLLRAPDAPVTVSDVPLLDEVAELLGEFPAPSDARRPRTAREDQQAYARGVLEVLHGSRSTDLEDGEESEQLSAGDLLGADNLADLLAARYEAADERTSAERAATDRTWAYGHVVVDEAQELTPLQWRVLARRCPTRSMTVVGDLHQSGTVGAAADWEQVRAWIGLADDSPNWHRRELTTSYRTPVEVMDVAARVLRRIDPEARPPRAVRRSGRPAVVSGGDRRELPRLALETALRAADEEFGTVAVIGVPEHLPLVHRALDDAPAPNAVRTRLSVLDPRGAKGLEFDHVVVLDPRAIAERGPRGLHDLYVATTRATRQVSMLGVQARNRCPLPTPSEPGT